MTDYVEEYNENRRSRHHGISEYLSICQQSVQKPMVISGLSGALKTVIRDYDHTIP